MDNTSVMLIPDQLVMKQKVDMPIFKATHWNLKMRNGRVQVGITMKRKITTEMMTTYFPTLLLTAITFATTFFKPFFFEAALSVNLTTMLVMTTIFISKMESLPPTSATKMIVYWLILFQLVPDSDEMKKEETNGDVVCDRVHVVPTTKCPEMCNTSCCLIVHFYVSSFFFF